MTPKSKGTASDEIMLFNKWSFKGVEVKDPGLHAYIALHQIFLPHSGGRHEHQRFEKSKVNIVERLVNAMMRHGSSAGKKTNAINTVRLAFEIIHLRTGRNPIEVLVRALENAAPCEETTRIGYGGIVYHKSVDVAPQRRLDLAMRFLSDGARKAAFSNRKTLEECLADELIAAADRDSRSFAVGRRDELERVALSSR